MDDDTLAQVFRMGVSHERAESSGMSELAADIKATFVAMLIAAPAEPQHEDDQAVDRFAARMKWKLARARGRGKSGWQDRAWTPEQISQALREHVEKGDPLDVANYCMFLAARNEPIAAPAEKQEPRDVRNGKGAPFSAEDLRLPLPAMPEPFECSTEIAYALYRAPELHSYGAACWRAALKSQEGANTPAEPVAGWAHKNDLRLLEGCIALFKNRPAVGGEWFVPLYAAPSPAESPASTKEQT